MNDTELRKRFEDLTDGKAGVADLRRVTRRARVLRVRRGAATLAVAALTLAALAAPLSGLRHLGEASPSLPSPAAVPPPGDGRIGFAVRDGWQDLRANDTSICTTTGEIADSDVGYARQAGTVGAVVCIDSAATLAADGVAFAAWVQGGRYTWSPPSANFPSSMPLQLDPSKIETQWEGRPNDRISREMLHATVDWRSVDIWVYFGRLDPSTQDLTLAQSRLDDLFVDAPASLGADIAFAPVEGWTSTNVTAPTFTPFAPPAIAAVTSNVQLSPADPESVYPPGLTNNQLEDLSSDGIAIGVEQVLFTKNPVPASSGYAPGSLPIDLRDAKIIQGGGEGLPRADITDYYVRTVINGRPIIIQTWFGTADPGPDLVREAQDALNRLVVVPTPPPNDVIDDVGVSMILPAGWHGILYSYGDGAANLVASTTTAVDTDWERARTSLGLDDVAIVMQESQALVELEGWAPLNGPVAIGSNDLCEGCESLDDGRPPQSGHALYLDTFTTGGRAFDLYVEFGSAPSQEQIDAVNAVLATLAFQAIVDPSYSPAPGTTRVGPIYDGEDKPEVAADDTDRRLTWAYEHATMTLPSGWTGQSYPVAGLERPISLLAAGSWDFTPGGYCGPINALRELPADGALVWFDGYGGNPPDGITFTSQPSSVDLEGAATDTSPCFGGSTPYVFRWAIGDRYVVAHAALGTNASPSTIADAEAALESITVG